MLKALTLRVGRLLSHVLVIRLVVISSAPHESPMSTNDGSIDAH
jgi:hypothetical protein